MAITNEDVLKSFQHLDSISPSIDGIPCFRDDRTEHERHTHTILVGGKDTFMSSFGPGATGKYGSHAYWATTPELQERVFLHVSAREEFRHVTMTDDLLSQEKQRIEEGTILVHIYVVTENHPYVQPFRPKD